MLKNIGSDIMLLIILGSWLGAVCVAGFVSIDRYLHMRQWRRKLPRR